MSQRALCLKHMPSSLQVCWIFSSHILVYLLVGSNEADVQRRTMLWGVKISRQRTGSNLCKCCCPPARQSECQPHPCLCHLLRLWFLILLLSPNACQDGWPFVIGNPQAQTTLHRSLFGGGGSVVGAEVTKWCAWLCHRNSVNRFLTSLWVLCKRTGREDTR